jgi:hypothetical protein
MPKISMTEGFVSSLAHLDGVDAKRTAAFLDKLLREPDASSLHMEIVHDAPDRSVRSMRVTRELRAIVCVEPDHVLLLHIDHHDAAYAWAREHCVLCDPVDGSLEVVRVEVREVPQPHPAGRVTCTVDDTGSLCRVLDEHGIAHELTV